jgi:predicted RNA-binding protein with PUA-like domain
MNVWLLKTEPAECSIDDIRAAAGGVMRWDGIRNYQARNCLRDAVREGDLCLIYHSGIREPALVGCAEVVRAAYPDPSQFDAASRLHDPASSTASPRWVCIDIRYRAHFPRPVTLAAIRAHADLGAMVLLRQGRLSVQPVTAAEWRVIAALAGAAPA